MIQWAMNKRDYEFPTDREELLIVVFSLKDHPPFICGANGNVTAGDLEDIEDDISNNLDSAQDRDGEVLYSVRYHKAHFDDPGDSDYWEYEEIAFRPLEDLEERELT